MTAYLKKAYNIGPFRINLSKSGLGISFGVTGFRVGTGPNGPYLHAGRGGLYVKKSLKQTAEESEVSAGDITEELEQAVPEPKTKFQKIFKIFLNIIVGVIIFEFLLVFVLFYFIFKTILSGAGKKQKTKINRRSKWLR